GRPSCLPRLFLRTHLATQPNPPPTPVPAEARAGRAPTLHRRDSYPYFPNANQSLTCGPVEGRMTAPMNRLKSLPCLVVFAVVFTLHSASAALTHRWSFTETTGPVVDSIGSANGSLQVLGTTNSLRTNGVIRLNGGARGTSDYILLPPGLLQNLTNVSIEIWARPRAAQNWSRLFDFGPGDDTQ